MKVKLKLPEHLPLLPKKRIFKRVPNIVLVGGAATAVAGGVWYGHKKGLIKNSLLDKILGPAGGSVPLTPPGAVPPVVTQPASSISLSAYPPVVRPNSQVTITGEFMGPGGQPVTVAGGYYAVFEELQDVGTGQRRMIDSGLLGQNITMYSRTIPTTNYLDGTYTIVVSDQPISGDPGLGNGIPSSAAGQAGFQPDVSPISTSPFDSGGSNYGITLS